MPAKKSSKVLATPWRKSSVILLKEYFTVHFASINLFTGSNLVFIGTKGTPLFFAECMFLHQDRGIFSGLICVHFTRSNKICLCWFQLWLINVASYISLWEEFVSHNKS